MLKIEILKKTVFTVYLVLGAVSDARRKSVPLWWVITGLVMAVVFAAGSHMAGRTDNAVSADTGWGSPILGAATAFPFAALSLAGGKWFGRADGFVMLSIGLITGPLAAAGIFAIAFTAAAVFGTAASKIGPEHDPEAVSDNVSGNMIPFIPFLTAGWIVEMVLINV